MIIYASNGREYTVPNGVEGEEMGPPENTRLVIRNGAGDPIAFFNMQNIDGWGQDDQIEALDSNSNA